MILRHHVRCIFCSVAKQLSQSSRPPLLLSQLTRPIIVMSLLPTHCISLSNLASFIQQLRLCLSLGSPPVLWCTLCNGSASPPLPSVVYCFCTRTLCLQPQPRERRIESGVGTTVSRLRSSLPPFLSRPNTLSFPLLNFLLPPSPFCIRVSLTPFPPISILLFRCISQLSVQCAYSPLCGTLVQPPCPSWTLGVAVTHPFVGGRSLFGLDERLHDGWLWWRLGPRGIIRAQEAEE